MSDYIRDLIRREKRVLAREESERKLVEGLNSGPATELTKKDWKELRQGVRKRVAARKR